MNILLGISGGIAAYKTPELVRRLKDSGADVRVVMSRSAHQFVTATTLQAVSGEPVRDNLWDSAAEAAMGHIELARWADAVVIAPATAEVISRLAQGSAGDLLTTLVLATTAPVTIAPAMNHVMWQNVAVQDNVRTLTDRGVRILGPAEGDQACGETGPGRMVEPHEIVDAVSNPTSKTGPLAGRRVLVTAGPTREPIDPVRYISNHSSGKMGYAIAGAARDAGADVVLLSGPVALDAPVGVERILIETAQELYEATHERVADCDIFIAAAAVADYRPESPAESKIKKSSKTMSLELSPAPDVLASVAALANKPYTVGFAAETDRVRDYALAKLDAKKLDMIIANKVGDGLAFGQDDNTVHAFWRTGDKAFPTASKVSLADGLIELIAERFDMESGTDTVAELPALKEPARAKGQAS